MINLFDSVICNAYFDIQILNLMGVLMGKLKGRDLHPTQIIQSKKQSQIIPQQQPRVRKQRPVLLGKYDPAPIFKKISENKMKAIEKSPILKEFIYSQNWFIYPQIIEHLRIFNVFQCIQASNAHTLTVLLYQNIISNCTSKLRIQAHQSEHQHQYSFKIKKQIVQQYSDIYASIFGLQFISLRKLIIKGQTDNNHKEAIASLQVLQYLDSPCLQELHADGHNLVSIKFLKKCHWKYLTTLSLRGTKICDGNHFAQVLPYISNSRHIQTLNLDSFWSTEWSQVSWILKMGFDSAEKEKARLDEDDDYYYTNNQKVLRRVEFGFPSKRNRQKHTMMIRSKFNNSYFDNPLVLW